MQEEPAIELARCLLSTPTRAPHDTGGNGAGARTNSVEAHEHPMYERRLPMNVESRSKASTSHKLGLRGERPRRMEARTPLPTPPPWQPLPTPRTPFQTILPEQERWGGK